MLILYNKIRVLMNRILIVDDDPTFRVMLQTYLTKMGFNTEIAATAKDCLKLLNRQVFDLILIDFRLPDKNGLELLKEIKNIATETPLILMTSYVDIKTAVKAIKSGAFEYVTKPINTDEILLTIRNALGKPATAVSEKKHNKLEFVRGKSPAADKISQYIELVAPTNISVIIQGESGTGKEFVSQMVHTMSKRADRPFIAIDCGALSRELAASELFGHLKGSFTGAVQDKAGQFEVASNGTLFLDEIGNLSYDIQVKLLRALQERKIRRIGSNTDIEVDVRIIAATNEDLVEFVKKGNFREDLYHRLNEFKINIPPLRDRGSDIFIYALHFLERSNNELEKSVQGFDISVQEKFGCYSWPGNLRELKNVVRRAVLLAPSDGWITLDCLPEEIVTPEISISNEKTVDHTIYDLKIVSEKNEKALIEKTLLEVRYNKSKAAKILNIDRKTLYNKMKLYGIEE
jgi:two-component system response regulator HydG